MRVIRHRNKLHPVGDFAEPGQDPSPARLPGHTVRVSVAIKCFLILKGAMLFVACRAICTRLLRTWTSLDSASLSGSCSPQTREIIELPGDDGIVFEPDKLVTDAMPLGKMPSMRASVPDWSPGSNK